MSVNKLQILRITTGETRNIVIPLNLTFKPIDKWELIENLIDKEKEKKVNKIVDWDLWDYYPIDSNDKKINTIEYKFYWNINGSLSNNYSDFLIKQFGGTLGLSLNKIKEKNYYKRSFIRLNYYDSPDVNNQKLLLTEDLKLSDTLPNTTNETRFIYQVNENKVGYFISWLKNDNITNGEIYMKPIFFNAKNGRSFELIKYQGNIIDINTLNQNYSDINYVKIILNKQDLVYNVDGFNYVMIFQYNRLD